MILISILSQIPPFILLKNITLRDEKIYSFLWYIYIASVITFFEIILYKMNIDRTLLFNLFTPIEIGFFFYIPLILTIQSNNEKIVIVIISMMLVLAIVIYMKYSNTLDTYILYIESITSLIACALGISRIQHISIKDYRIWVISGIAIYSIINCYTYPAYNLLANILMNISFTIGLITYKYENRFNYII